MVPTDTEFRAAGFTAAARDFPLSPAGQAVIAAHNGVTVEQLLPAHRYSSNALMHEWIEALGAALVEGRPCRDPDGRWFSMRRLKNGA